MSHPGSTIAAMGSVDRPLRVARAPRARPDELVSTARSRAWTACCAAAALVASPRRVESELLAITGAVSAGHEDAAAERAERLAERLEHPSARRSS